MREPAFRYVAERAVLVEFDDTISDEVNRVVIALDRAIAGAEISGVIEVIPALVNLLVIFDPLATDHAAVEAAVRGLLPLEDVSGGGGAVHEIEVCYGGEFGQDLQAVAEARGISAEEVIAAHVGSELTVSMYGFAPGFAYLSGLPEAIRVPRKPAAVRDIPSGSIIIAGQQCLVTSIVMPTGWSIIGRSPTEIIRPEADKPFRFDVGDRVVFRRVGPEALA